MPREDDRIDTETIRRMHTETPTSWWTHECSCGGGWPCPTLALLDEIDRLDAENAAMRPVVDAALRVRAATDGRSALDAGDALADTTDRFAAWRSVRRTEEDMEW